MKKRYRSPRKMEEFYDLEKDPLENMNLINDHEYATTINELKKRLENWIIETNDLLLKGRVKPQKNVILRYKNIELLEHIYLPFLGLLQRLLRIKCLHKILRKLLRYIP